MKLVKTGFEPFVTEDATVIEAFKQNGWTEEEPKEVKATPKKKKED